jgi:hypothetical protein
MPTPIKTEEELIKSLGVKIGCLEDLIGRKFRATQNHTGQFWIGHVLGIKFNGNSCWYLTTILNTFENVTGDWRVDVISPEKISFIWL